MTLAAGSRLGPYEIHSPLGAGGMGEVYLAQDTRLNRTVAVKVMPPHFAADPEMKQRFDREAQVIANLNHPNICVLHDIGSHADHDFIVMELLEGETLAARLERGRDPSSHTQKITQKSGSGTGSGATRSATTRLVSRPFTIEEALGIAIQIADALDKAHQNGIIHRDLKPANVMLSKASGARPGALQVKLLDFGLAKWKPAVASLASAVTVQADLTAKGAVLGTMRYMAPEQLEGEEADARTDIFALGTILYEVITGKKAFEGKNHPSLAGAIMTAEPVPVSRLQPLTPPPLERAIKRCLAKDPDDRWQTAHDLLIQLRWIAEHGDAGETPTAVTARKRDWLALAGLGLGLALVAAAARPAYLFWKGPEPEPPLQFRVSVYGLNPSDTAISPDGKLLALVARPNTTDAAALYIRPVGAIAFRRVAGTDDAARPFWSPDSRSVAFISAGKLRKVEAASGSPKEIGDAEGFTGGTWSRDNVILFGSTRGLFRISAEGGTAEALTTVDKSETGHFWPHFLPDGRHYLYLSWSDAAAKRAVMVGALGSAETKTLFTGETNVAYAEPGFLVFHRGATVFAQRFDAGSQTLEGEPVQVAGNASFSSANGRGHFDVSQSGALVYHQGGGGASGRAQVQPNVVVYGWRDRHGTILGQVGEQGSYGDIDLSPNGKLVALTRQDSGSAGADIWVTDWERNVTQKLTLDPGDDMNPVWVPPDGRRVAFTSYRNGNADVFVRNADATGDDVPLLNSPADEVVEDWSRDGRFVAYKLGRDGFEDLYVVPIEPDGKPGKSFPVAQGRYQKDEPQFSYDGKWLAYTSNESGTFQVYVVSLPDLAQKHQVTPPDGGGQPRWRGDGKELFYRALDGRVMVVDMALGPKISSGIPRLLFAGPNVAAARDPVRHQWAVAPDGQKFLLRLGNNSGTTGGNRGGVPVAPVTFNVASPIGAPGAATSPLANGLTVVLHWPSLVAGK